MKCYSRVALCVLMVMLIFYSGAIAYETNNFSQYKLKNETENLLTGIYSPEVKKLNINEEKLFYTAMKSSADDQFQAGLLFGQGQDVKRNFSKCISLFEKAAGQGHMDASFLLGTIYLKGGSIFKEIKTDVEYSGIVIPAEFPYDINRAFHYYLISGNKGDKLSLDGCTLIKKQLLDLNADTSKTEKMRQNLEEFAGTGNALAQRFLAELYSEGKLVEQDDYKAFDLFKKSAEGGDVWGEYNIARRYIAGLGVARDTSKGFGWMKKAAEHNLAVAQFDLAVLYYLGTGTDINRQMGYVWLLVAKANGYKEAESLVNDVDNGGLTPEEEKKAYEIASKLLTQMLT
jgi:uncharacterized protein